MAHVQRAGHVGRRHGDGVVLVRVALGLGAEDPGLLPAREHARLDLGRVVAGALLEGFEAVGGHGRQV